MQDKTVGDNSNNEECNLMRVSDKDKPAPPCCAKNKELLTQDKYCCISDIVRTVIITQCNSTSFKPIATIREQ